MKLPRLPSATDLFFWAALLVSLGMLGISVYELWKRGVQEGVRQEVAPVVASTEGKAVAASTGQVLRDNIQKDDRPWKDLAHALQIIATQEEQKRHDAPVRSPTEPVASPGMSAVELCRVRHQWSPGDPCRDAHQGNPQGPSAAPGG